MIVYAALIIALTVPILFLIALNKFDLHKTGKFYVNLITLICGGVAYYLAAQINPAMLNAGWVTRSQIIRITAPILEEILKSLILIALVSRADFNYVVDGAIYGFGAGIGFAVFENIEYVLGNSEIAMTIAVARVFSTNLIHATASGLIGTALAYYHGDKNKLKSSFVVFLGYALAIGVHMGFNTMVSGGGSLIFAIIFGTVGVSLIWYVIRSGLAIQKNWVVEKLGMADRVTKAEMKVVSNLNIVNEVLAPFEARFGQHKTSLVRNLLYKQAEIGIKRKLIETAVSESRKKEIEEIIADLNKEVGRLRSELGTYCMMMVRTVYLDNEIQIWTLLNARIAAAGPVQKGGGLWNTVSTRIKDQSSSDAKEEEQ